jgi:hypothetical protein
MNGNTGGSDSRGRSPVRRLGARASAAAAVALLAAVALVATACGGGGGGASGSGGKSRYQQALAFSECMRAHGVPNFPDPGGNGDFTIQGGGPASHGQNQSIGGPQMTRANRECAHLLPNGGVPTAAQRQQMQRQGLRFAECMRAHGVSNFPDPPTGAGGGPVKLNLNPRSPQFQSAQHACLRLLGPGSFGIRVSS